MKRNRTYFLALTAMVLAFGCANPREPLAKYLDASLHERYDEAYQYISSKDRAVKTLQEYKSEFSKEESPLGQLLLSKVSYNIKDIQIEKGKAKATVEITMPDFSSIMGDLLGAAFASAFGQKKDQKAMEQMLADKYKDKEMPMVTQSNTFNLIKESDGWKVFLNWEKQKKIENLTKEAEKLEKDKNFVGAKGKYLEILKLDSESLNAGKKNKELDEKIANQKEKLGYIDKVIIIESHIGQSFLGEAGIFGELKNMGDRELTEVEITIYFLDKNDKPIFEKNYNPVLVSEFSFGDEGKPLKPGYSRKFGVRADDAPSEWSKKVQVKVTDIEFMK